MARHKKGISQKISDFTYAKPVLNSRMLEIRKHFKEVAAMLEVKEKKR